MTKCTFHKFGTSGNIEKHDALCILPLNIGDYSGSWRPWSWTWQRSPWSLWGMVGHHAFQCYACCFQSTKKSTSSFGSGFSPLASSPALSSSIVSSLSSVPTSGHLYSDFDIGDDFYILCVPLGCLKNQNVKFVFFLLGFWGYMVSA